MATMAGDEGVAVLCPEQSEGTTARIGAWLKAVGDRVEAGEPLLEIETDKVALEVPAPAAGRLVAIVATGGEVSPGTLLGRIAPQEAAGAAPADPAPAPAEPVPPVAAVPPEVAVPAAVAARHRSIADFDPDLRLSPSVRRLLAETDLDPGTVAGTGRDGRITRDDVEGALARRTAQARVTDTPEPRETPRPAAPPGAGPGTSERVPHDTMRRRIAEHMARSVATAPHVTAVFEVDFSAILAHRRAHKEAFARDGVALTLTAYAVQASVAAMRAVPAVNARWHEEALEIFTGVNVGVGTALGETGLIVPVIHDAGALSLLGIARRLGELTEHARTGGLTPDDVRGGTFTISNHGVSGSLVASPIIINQPQVAILGIGKLEKRVVVREVEGVDTIQIRPLAYVTLTIDHRALDGARTNAWLSRFKETIEGWA